MNFQMDYKTQESLPRKQDFNIKIYAFLSGSVCKVVRIESFFLWVGWTFEVINILGGLTYGISYLYPYLSTHRSVLSLKFFQRFC